MQIKRAFKSVELSLKKAVPDIMLVLGIGLSAAAAFEFCKHTPEAEPVVDEFLTKVDEFNEACQTKEPMGRSYAREIAVEATKNVSVGLTKAYWKPVLMWTTSTGLIIGSHTILKSRNVALAALATGLGTELRTLHSRIIERYGEQVDYELKHGIIKKEIEETHIDEASGSEVVENKQIQCIDYNGTGGLSIYARFFDDSCRPYRKDPEYNLEYLKRMEAECNRILREEGVLFLNEVYDKLDMKKTRAGQKVGWRYYKHAEDNLYGDNYVSFGIHNVHRAANRDFVNGYESVILLDFNVDGEVIDALPPIL